MSGSDQRKLPAVRTMLWRVFAANAAVFTLAFALLALTPFEIHARIRLLELVILLVGLAVMLLVDLLLLRHALTPLARLARVMGRVDPLRPGARATGFERSSSEVLALAESFNHMLERLEQERRDSTSRVLTAHEDERLRIARELHDELGQTLTAVALRAELRASRAGPESSEFAELAEIVQQSLAEVRRISMELRPAALEQLGLVNALISLCTRVAQQSGITVRRKLDAAGPSIPSEVELAIYRIAQEALTNVVRHSHATEVTVSLGVAGDELELSVADNGRGLSQAGSEGSGVSGMRERAMLIGAELKIESAAPGVTVTLRLPLEHAALT